MHLPDDAEFRVEPEFDYPGQQVAIDLAAPTDANRNATVEAVRDALFLRFRIATRTGSELDREATAKQTA